MIQEIDKLKWRRRNKSVFERVSNSGGFGTNRNSLVPLLVQTTEINFPFPFERCLHYHYITLQFICIGRPWIRIERDWVFRLLVFSTPNRINVYNFEKVRCPVKDSQWEVSFRYVVLSSENVWGPSISKKKSNFISRWSVLGWGFYLVPFFRNCFPDYFPFHTHFSRREIINLSSRLLWSRLFQINSKWIVELCCRSSDKCFAIFMKFCKMFRKVSE